MSMNQMKHELIKNRTMKYVAMLGCRSSVAFACVLIAVSVVLIGCRPVDEGNDKVVLYCSVDQVLAERIIPEIEERTGLDIDARYDTEATKTVGLVQRIRAESESPSADVFWSSEVFHTIRLAREGMFAEYGGEGATNRLEQFVGSGRKWFGFGLRSRVIGFNTNKVSADEAPASLEELLDAKWRGRLVMAEPEFGTTGGAVASWFVHYGTNKAEEILRRLKANEVRVVEGNSTALRQVAMGQADVCMTDTDDVYAGQRNGWPVDFNWLMQGGDGTLAIPNTAAMIKGCPHPAAAERLMEFLLGTEVERTLAESYSHNSPVHPALAGEYKEYANPAPLNIDYAKVAEVLPGAIKTAGDILK